MAESKRVGFTANSVFEELFIASPADEVFGGGLPGGGKTYTLMARPMCPVDPEKNLTPRCLHPKYEGWCFRRNEGRDQVNFQKNIQYAREFFPVLGGTETGNGTRWKFPQGGTFTISHMADPRDWTQIQGHEVADLLFDELPEFLEDQYGMAKAWCRAAAFDLVPRVASTGNPVGPGVAWVKKRFVSTLAPFLIHTIEDEYGTTTRQFIPWGFRDNPDLMRNDPAYEARLTGIPNPHIRRAFLSRSAIEAWNVIVGSFFNFDSSKHIVGADESAVIEQRLKDTKAVVTEAFDWGGKVATCLLSMAKDTDGTIYVTDCYYVTDKPLEYHIPNLKRFRKKWEGQRAFTVGDGSIWAIKAHYVKYTQESIGHILSRPEVGMYVTPANKDKPSGFARLHSLLFFDGDSAPKLRIFDRCRPLIDELAAAIVSEGDPNSMHKDSEDHAIDALRYGVMHITGNRKENGQGIVKGSIEDDFEKLRKVNRNKGNMVWGVR